jgi:hypothetical protein
LRRLAAVEHAVVANDADVPQSPSFRQLHRFPRTLRRPPSSSRQSSVSGHLASGLRRRRPSRPGPGHLDRVRGRPQFRKRVPPHSTCPAA